MKTVEEIDKEIKRLVRLRRKMSDDSIESRRKILRQIISEYYKVSLEDFENKKSRKWDASITPRNIYYLLCKEKNLVTASTTSKGFSELSREIFPATPHSVRHGYYRIKDLSRFHASTAREIEFLKELTKEV